MRKKIHFHKVNQTAMSLELLTEEKISFRSLEAAGQMIVDSDETAFIYLASNEKEYVYFYIHEQVWPALKAALASGTKIEAISHDERLELIDFHEELHYLIENIQGNGNYGEEMVKKVEATFLSAL